MAISTGIEGIVGGGSASSGRDVRFVLRTYTGRQSADLSFDMPHDMIPAMISHLVTYAGMARDARMSDKPDGDAEETFAGKHALRLTDATCGRSVAGPELARVNLQFDASHGRKLDFYLTADADGLDALADACRAAKALLI